MHDQLLIVSDPPQGEVQAGSSAPCVGLTANDVRMKARYGVPEIWVADRSRIRIEATAQTLRLAGHKLAVLPGRWLLLPPQASAASFLFGETGLVVRLHDESEVEIPYDASIVAILCTPRRLMASRKDISDTGSGLARVREPMLAVRERPPVASERDDPAAFLHLFVSTNTGLIRIAFLADEADFAGLGTPHPPHDADRLTLLMGECESRFVNARLDRRLVDMRQRQRPQPGNTASYRQTRRGYSFGSMRLSQLLDGIAPGLGGLSHAELASRLAYLTARPSPAPW